EAGRDPRLAGQRLRQLHQHAHRPGPRGRRDRTADAPAGGLARRALLHGPRAGRPGLDRGHDPALRREPRARGGLHCAQGGVQRGSAGRADPGDQHDQWLEPALGRFRQLDRSRTRQALPAARGGMSAGSIHDDAAAGFGPLRPHLMRVAYRMLGSVADAEDVVQEAFIRWMDADREAVREPAAFLRRTVTRLCLDQLKSAHRRREVYVGPWLPEPVVVEEIDEDVTLPLLLALERLSPLERAAFLLHDVFDIGFDEVAETLGRDPAACRQLAKRARAHVREARPRFRIERARAL